VIHAGLLTILKGLSVMDTRDEWKMLQWEMVRSFYRVFFAPGEQYPAWNWTENKPATRKEYDYD